MFYSCPPSHPCVTRSPTLFARVQSPSLFEPRSEAEEPALKRLHVCQSGEVANPSMSAAELSPPPPLGGQRPVMWFSWMPRHIRNRERFRNANTDEEAEDLIVRGMDMDMDTDTHRGSPLRDCCFIFSFVLCLCTKGSEHTGRKEGQREREGEGEKGNAQIGKAQKRAERKRSKKGRETEREMYIKGKQQPKPFFFPPNCRILLTAQLGTSTPHGFSR